MDMLTHEEILEIMVPMLQRADARGRAYAASMAMAAALETFAPEDRRRALDDAIQTFRRLLVNLPFTAGQP